MFDYLFYIYVVVAGFVGWMLVSRLQRGFTVFATIGDYLAYKTIIAILIGIPAAPFYAIYAIVKADSAAERKRILACVGVFLIAIPLAHFYDESQKAQKVAPVKAETKAAVPAKKEVSATQSVPQEKQSTIASGAPLSAQDFTLDGIRLGQNINDVIATQGQPKSKEQMNDGMGYEFKRVIAIANSQGKVIGLMTESQQVTTSRGINKFSSVDAIIKAYGTSFRKTAYKNLDLYEYELASSDGKQILRFAVDQNTKILDYIGVRMVTE